MTDRRFELCLLGLKFTAAFSQNMKKNLSGEDEFISYSSQVPTLFLQGGSACFSATFSSITVVYALLAHIREQHEAFFTSESLASCWAASL